MDNRKIRQIIHEICDHFYTQIKDETEWENVNKLSQEYYERYKHVPLALDLIRALVAEWGTANLERQVPKAAQRKKESPPPPRICYICGKEIEGEEPEYIKTKRGTNIYIHRRCVPGRR